MMHSEQAKVVQWYIEETNKIIARQTKLYPNTFRGVCGLPQTPGVSPKEYLPYPKNWSRKTASSAAC